MRGEQVTSLKKLCELASEKRSVEVVYPPMPCKPAAFIISMQARLVQIMFDSGMYVYEKREKEDGRQ
jgi:hypothetical protein